MQYERLTAAFILRYINRYLSVPLNTISKDSIEEYSHQRWAAYEILERIKKNPDKDGQYIVEEFIRELYRCRNHDYGSDRRWAEMTYRFDVAQDTAEDILVWFIINRKEKKHE